jgi:hypothetical protein
MNQSLAKVIVFVSYSPHNLDSDHLHTFSLSQLLQTIMIASSTCRFVLFSFLSLSANAETIRGAQHRQLDAADKSARPDMISLGSVITHDYAILAKTGISTVPASAITGNIGVSPIAATAVTGFALIADSTTQFATSTQVVGRVYAADYGGQTEVDLTTATVDVLGAYNSAAEPANSDGKLNLGDLGVPLTGIVPSTEVLRQGVYTFDSSVTIAGDFEFKGSSTDIFIIQIEGDLLQVAGTQVTLVTDGSDNTVPRKENIFWQVSGEVTVKTGAHLEGILLSQTDVTFEANSSLNGRVLTQTRCNLDQATINSA